jgi:prepilin-type N-terminal cleavage/methylation domain-containing protein
MKLHRHQPSYRQRGFTLLEVVIALVLLLIVSLSYMTTSIFNARTSARAKVDVFALELVNRTLEDMRTSNFNNLGTSTAPESKFLTAQTNRMDRSDPNSISFTVNCAFSGFGSVAAVSGTTLRATFPTGFPAWRTDQWKGHKVMIQSGTGVGQIMYITGNSADTLTICRNLDGSGGGGWYKTPAVNDTFNIDNGKTATVTVSWTERGVTRTEVRSAMIPMP